ncbi:MAG: hypothetical protein ACR2NA_08820 [Solirubrobacterales bacterium]
MAARRLVIAMVALLAVLTGATLLAAEVDRLGPRTTGTGTETETAVEAAPSPPSGRTLRRTLRVSDEKRDAETIQAEVGDELELTVQADSLLEVAIPDLGRIEPVADNAPATIVEVLDRPGAFSITVTEPESRDDRQVAELVVSEPDEGR